MSIQVLHEKCERNKADDKKLPSDSFLVTYKVEEEVKYDVARGGGLVEIFDHYYDTYKNVQSITWTSGIVSPRTFDGANPPTPPKKRKKQ